MHRRSGTKHRVAGEGQLLLESEDPGLHSAGTRVDHDEDRLELAHLLGDPPELLGRPVERVAEDHDQPVASVRSGGEDIDVAVGECRVR